MRSWFETDASSIEWSLNLTFERARPRDDAVDVDDDDASVRRATATAAATEARESRVRARTVTSAFDGGVRRRSGVFKDARGAAPTVCL